MPKIKIHIVCRGNVYRSRVAEAYLRSLDDKDIEVSSSGIDAGKYSADFLSPWAQAIGSKYDLTSWFSSERQQTTDELLRAADLIIFMHPSVYHDAQKHYNFNPNLATVWTIKDREDWRLKLTKARKQELTWRRIKRLLDQYLADVRRGSWVEVVDENNEPLDFSLPITLANLQGLWHRGIHAIITTPDHKTVVQKRSGIIMFSAGYLDISLGGHVDVGESPEQTLIRETFEEIGVKVTMSEARLLSVKKYSNYHPHYHRDVRTIMYSYHVQLPETHPVFTPQTSEVAAIRLLSPRQLKRLLKYHRLKGFGPLNYPYHYYAELVKQAGL